MTAGAISEPLDRAARAWRRRVLVATWLSYAGFYFCRKNFAIVKSSLLDAMQIGTSELAHVFTAFLFAYMLGQFLSGFLGQRIPTRTLLLVGMATTAACNVAFGFCYLMGPAGYWPLLLLMIVNGLAQATGWPGNVGVLSNWLRRRERGRIMALWATCYQIGSIFAKAFAAYMLALAGAAWSFWGAALVLAAIWVLFFFIQRDAPEDVGLPPIVADDADQTSTPEENAGPVRTSGAFVGMDRNAILTILFMGACYFVFKFLRYALDSWSPLAIEELFGIAPANAGYISTAFDTVGFVGVLFAGWASDRFFGGRRYQTIVLMTAAMLLAFVFLGTVGLRQVTLFAVGLSLCGFMLMGPDSLLSGTGAIDVGGRSGAVVAAGIINGLGSIGPIFQEEIIGLVFDRYGKLPAFYLMIGVSVLGVVGTLYLASRSRRRLSAL